MGEVYKAKDTRLDRSVAIKVLSSHLSGSSELRERFEREARAVSSLNHPNICTLHDIGREGKTDFLVMEHIEGESLADRLKKGPLPFDDALTYATQIADALEKAHRAGVVHRDLKPGNVMITKTGAKLLDFGLAKLAGSATPTPEVSTLSALPTEHRSLTAAGTILGTFQYMAPEQLEGGEIDARTDIFALGAVIYEMVTGKKAFEGKSQASLISAIMSANPEPVSSVTPLSPVALEHVIRRCLVKEPDQRWQSAGDVARELEWIKEAGPLAGLGVARGVGRERIVWAAVSFVVGIAAAAILGWVLFSTPPEPKQVTRFDIAFPTNERWIPTLLALSPDGSHIAYVSFGQDGQHLYLRRMDQVAPTRVQGTANAIRPFFSADGQWVAFWADGKLQRVSVNGGLPVTLCDCPDLRGGSWGEDDVIVFGSTVAQGLGLSMVPAGGGTPEPLTELDKEKGEISHRLPDILPGGKGVVFTLLTNTNANVAALDRKSGEIQTLIEGASGGRYAPTGHLLYSQGNQLLAVPFDADSLEVKGAPVPMVEEVQANQFSIAQNGALVFGEGAAAALAPEVTLTLVDRQGGSRPLIEKSRTVVEPRLSPDGQRLALTAVEGQSIDIWVLELARETMTRLSFEQGNDSIPIWTPDGKQVTFSSDRNGGWNIFSVPSDGSGQPVQLTESEFPTTATSWSPDGKLLAFQRQSPETGIDIGVYSVEDGDETIFLSTPFNEYQATFSPDGRWLAYMSNESGREEVYVRAFPGPGGKWQISSEGGSHPMWSPKGGEIFFRHNTKMMAVPIEAAGSALTLGKENTLFEGDYRKAPFSFQELVYYDVTRDGKQFVMMKPVQRDDDPSTLHVVLNWFEELKARVPTE